MWRFYAHAAVFKITCVFRRAVTGNRVLKQFLRFALHDYLTHSRRSLSAYIFSYCINFYFFYSNAVFFLLFYGIVSKPLPHPPSPLHLISKGWLVWPNRTLDASRTSYRGPGRQVSAWVSQNRDAVHRVSALSSALRLTYSFIKENAFFVGPMPSCQQTDAIPHRPVGRPRSSYKISGHTVRLWNRAYIVAKRLTVEPRRNEHWYSELSATAK